MFIKDNRGDLRHWTIWYEEDEIIIKHGLYRGAMQEKREVVEIKGNNTLKEQIMSRVASRCSKQRDKGYVSTKREALSGKTTNAAGLPKPMLAQPIKNSQITGKYFVQYKYDGHRCIVHKQDGVMKAYSRNGKPIVTIDHILNDMHSSVNEGEFFDGELYIHGLSLQKIASLVKRKQPESELLTYMIYDTISEDKYGIRLERIRAVSSGFSRRYSSVPTRAKSALGGELGGLGNDINSPLDYTKSDLETAISNGYEGLIVRLNDRGYEDGRRSKSLIKVKKFEDDEFQVMGIHASVDNWAILECRTGKGVTFNVSAPGAIKAREEILQKSHEYIGKWINVEYSNITKGGVPFHPVATAFREMPIE